MKKNNKEYAPNLRTGYEPKKDALESHGKTHGMSTLPDCTQDAIVANNISNAEFDYTEELEID